MCQSLYNPDTEQEIIAQEELVALVGRKIWDQIEEVEPEEGFCLCNTNFEDMLSLAGYSWHAVDGNTDEIHFRKTSAHDPR